jgi:hypothetical protein
VSEEITMNGTTKTVAALLLTSCLTPVINAAPQRGRNRPPAEAWLIEKPIGGESAYPAPLRPLWKLADLKKMHAGQNTWSQPVVLDDEQEATYNSGAPGTKVTTRMHPQSATVFMIMAGQVRFTVEGQEPVLTKRGSIVNILKTRSIRLKSWATRMRCGSRTACAATAPSFRLTGPGRRPAREKKW